MVSKELQDFAASHRTFWWWVKDPRALDEESIVQGTLNYGDWDDVQELIRIMGMEEVARTFYRDIWISRRRRGNYYDDVINFFGSSRKFVVAGAADYGNMLSFPQWNKMAIR